MALRVSPDHVEASAATTKRALGYLRWYPSSWRARYGDEFVAHLEVELTERPLSLSRSFDIVAHGFLARLRFQHSLQIALRAVTAIVLLIGLSVGGIALFRYWAPVTITSGYGGGVTGVGLFATPSQINDVAFNFTTRTPVAIRITSVKVVPLPGFLAPKIVGVEFVPHDSELANISGWPIRLPKGTTAQAQGRAPLAIAIGNTVVLGRTDALWIGLRAPSLHRAYVVEDVQVKYVLRGVSHTLTISQALSPDVICSSSSRSQQIPAWCSQEMQNAAGVATVLKVQHDTTGRIADEANSVAELSINALTSDSRHGVPSLAAVRLLAIRLFPATHADGILSVTGVRSGSVPEWRFVIHDTASNRNIVRCTDRGRVNRVGTYDTIMGVGIVTCPS